MSILKTGTASTVVRTGATAALVLAAASGIATPSQATTTVSTQPAVTLSSALGPYGGGNTLTATAATNKFYTGKVKVQFQVTTSLTASCATNYSADTTAVAASTVNIISAKKITILVPSLASTNGTYYYLLCVYNSTNTSAANVPATLLGKAGYTAAGGPTITSASTVSIPTYGGTTISVSGANFSSGLTATLGGLPLTDINVIDSTWFTATTPAHAAGYATLSVTAAGGTQTQISNASQGWNYVDALSVSPSTLPVATAAAATTLDIQGYGFNSITWATLVDGTSPDSANSHVYVLPVLSTSGTAVPAIPKYSAVAFDNTSTTDKATAELSECTSPVVLSDSELTCTLDLYNTRVVHTVANALNPVTNAAHFAAGIYSVGIVNTGIAGGTVTGQASSGAAMVPYSTSTLVVAPF